LTEGVFFFFCPFTIEHDNPFITSWKISGCRIRKLNTEICSRIKQKFQRCNTVVSVSPPQRFSSFLDGLQMDSDLLKGLAHPKMKIKSLITHPHAVPTP